MTRKERYQHILAYFRENVPVAKSELNFNNPFELVVAVVLSAQCTDKRVNLITPALFAHYPTPEAMAKATEADLLKYMGSASYPNSKAKHIRALSEKLVTDFNGVVPNNHDDLESLPGVGRKTANVVMAVAFDEPAMPVDTHVFRVSHRLGLAPASATTPLAVEKELTTYIPREEWSIAHHWILLHGRYTCTARTPKCEICPLTEFCPTYTKLTHKKTATKR